MKKVLAVMLLMTIMVAGFGGGLVSVALLKLNGGGVAESFIYPLYGGQIVLSGIITTCAVILYDEIRELKKEIEELKRSQNKEQ